MGRVAMVDSLDSLARRQLPLPAGRHVMPAAGACGDMAHGLGDMALCRGVVAQASRHRPVLENEYQENHAPACDQPFGRVGTCAGSYRPLACSQPFTSSDFSSGWFWDLPGSESRTVESSHEFLDDERLNALEEVRNIGRCHASTSSHAGSGSPWCAPRTLRTAKARCHAHVGAVRVPLVPGSHREPDRVPAWPPDLGDEPSSRVIVVGRDRPRPCPARRRSELRTSGLAAQGDKRSRGVTPWSPEVQKRLAMTISLDV